MDCSQLGSSVLGILQARILEWVAMFSFRGSSPHWERTLVSGVADKILYRLSLQGSTLSVSLFSLPPQLPPHLHLAFKVSWRAEEILYRLDVDWPKYSEYFTGATFCVGVDSLNGLVYVAQVSKTEIFVFKVMNAKKTAFLCYCTKYLCTFMLCQLWNLFFFKVSVFVLSLIEVKVVWFCKHYIISWLTFDFCFSLWK